MKLMGSPETSAIQCAMKCFRTPVNSVNDIVVILFSPLVVQF